jgi:hypothetical protein
MTDNDHSLWRRKRLPGRLAAGRDRARVPLAAGGPDSSSTSAKPASRPPSTLSSARVALRRSPSGRTGAPIRRWTFSKAGWAW